MMTYGQEYALWLRAEESCHDDHSLDEVYETDAGTFRITRHSRIWLDGDEAEAELLRLQEWTNV